jgi:hypothetical protein
MVPLMAIWDEVLVQQYFVIIMVWFWLPKQDGMDLLLTLWWLKQLQLVKVWS